MNAGANGVETRERVVEVVAIDRRGERHVLSNADMGYSYRHAAAPDDFIFVEAIYEGVAEDRETIRAAMDAVQEHRETAQPVKSRTGGSTFKNPDPPGTPNQRSAWRLIDAAGCRGLQDRRRAGLRDALQFPHQHRRGDRPRPGAARRDGAGAGAGEFRRAAGMGDQADRDASARAARSSRSWGEAEIDAACATLSPPGIDYGISQSGYTLRSAMIVEVQDCSRQTAARPSGFRRRSRSPTNVDRGRDHEGRRTLVLLRRSERVGTSTSRHGPFRH